MEAAAPDLREVRRLAGEMITAEHLGSSPTADSLYRLTCTVQERIADQMGIDKQHPRVGLQAAKRVLRLLDDTELGERDGLRSGFLTAVSSNGVLGDDPLAREFFGLESNVDSVERFAIRMQVGVDDLELHGLSMLELSDHVRRQIIMAHIRKKEGAAIDWPTVFTNLHLIEDDAYIRRKYMQTPADQCLHLIKSEGDGETRNRMITWFLAREDVQALLKTCRLVKIDSLLELLSLNPDQEDQLTDAEAQLIDVMFKNGLLDPDEVDLLSRKAIESSNTSRALRSEVLKLNPRLNLATSEPLRRAYSQPVSGRPEPMHIPLVEAGQELDLHALSAACDSGDVSDRKVVEPDRRTISGYLATLFAHTNSTDYPDVPSDEELGLVTLDEAIESWDRLVRDAVPPRRVLQWDGNADMLMVDYRECEKRWDKTGRPSPRDVFPRELGQCRFVLYCLALYQERGMHEEALMFGRGVVSKMPFENTAYTKQVVDRLIAISEEGPVAYVTPFQEVMQASKRLVMGPAVTNALHEHLDTVRPNHIYWTGVFDALSLQTDRSVHQEVVRAFCEASVNTLLTLAKQYREHANTIVVWLCDLRYDKGGLPLEQIVPLCDALSTSHSGYNPAQISMARSVMNKRSDRDYLGNAIGLLARHGKYDNSIVIELILAYQREHEKFPVPQMDAIFSSDVPLEGENH